MADLTKVKEINRVIEAYFIKNASITMIPAKDLMPDFIRAGIFPKDQKKGLPIRKILRELDETNQLHLIPYVHAQRKEQNTYWYFIPANAPLPTIPYKQDIKKTESKRTSSSRVKSDEAYVIDLCDRVLGQAANRQKRFDFLLGDLHKNGKSRTKLPVDAYYENLHLVIEFKEIQHFEPVVFFDKPEKATISGLTRNEQRKIYDQRRIDVLPEHGIDLIAISHSDFLCDHHNKIIRDEASDLKTVRQALKDHIPL